MTDIAIDLIEDQIDLEEAVVYVEVLTLVAALTCTKEEWYLPEQSVRHPYSQEEVLEDPRPLKSAIPIQPQHGLNQVKSLLAQMKA